MYNIVFSRLIEYLLPYFHRKPVMIAWIEVLMYPFSSVYGFWLDYFTEKRFDAWITGQVAMLQYMLNTKFYGNGNLLSIYIVDDYDDENDVMIFNKHEQETETFIYNTDEEADEEVYVFNSNEVGYYDFIVMVPEDLEFDENYMRSLINKFKLAGMSYTIQTY